MNGRFHRRIRAPKSKCPQQFPCCVRAQQENQIHRLGSERSFVATMTEGCSADEANGSGARALVEHLNDFSADRVADHAIMPWMFR